MKRYSWSSVALSIVIALAYLEFVVGTIYHWWGP